jgi:hypothetical protein
LPPARFGERFMAGAPTTATWSNRAPLEANGRRQGRQHLIEKIRVVQGNRPDFYSAFVNYA